MRLVPWAQRVCHSDTVADGTSSGLGNATFLHVSIVLLSSSRRRLLSAKKPPGSAEPCVQCGLACIFLKMGLVPWAQRVGHSDMLADGT